jgi:hypothetical protein
MSALVILTAYLVVGAGSAIAVAIERRTIGPIRGVPAAFLMLVLWPFILPGVFFGDTSPMPRSGPHEARILPLAERARGLWASTRMSGKGLDAVREQAAIDSFVEHLRANDRRLWELDRTLGEAPASVRLRLVELRVATSREIDEGLAILEELIGRVLVLRFSDPGSELHSERERIEELLARIEAQAEL